MNTISCPHCSQAVENSPQLVGQRVACPKCNRPFSFPPEGPIFAESLIVPRAVNLSRRRRVDKSEFARLLARGLLVGITLALPSVLVFGTSIYYNWLKYSQPQSDWSIQLVDCFLAAFALAGIPYALAVVVLLAVNFAARPTE